MSELGKKIATRESYGNALVELGKEHEDLIVLDADLAGATKTGIFKKAFPERHWDIGIAEANMTGIAAGLATCGKVPFISSFAMFAAGRNYEQVRNSIGYPHLNVKIGATHAGISVGEDGATHQCLEDLALMRAIPGMVVLNPADDVEARAAVHAAYDHVGPVYLRFGRLAVPVFNDEATYRFEIGKGIVLKEGKDVSVFATGLCVNEAREAEKLLAAAIDTPVSVMETAGEGGPWGMALLASYLTWKGEDETLQNYLEGKVFAGNAGLSEEPDAKDIEGFEKFIENYKGAIAVEKTASEVIK